MSYLSGIYYWLYFSETIIDLKWKVTELCEVYAPTGNNGQTTAHQSWKSLNNSSLKGTMGDGREGKKYISFYIFQKGEIQLKKKWGMTLTGVYIQPEKSNAMCCNLWKGWEAEGMEVTWSGWHGLLQARNTLLAQGLGTHSGCLRGGNPRLFRYTTNVLRRNL